MVVRTRVERRQNFGPLLSGTPNEDVEEWRTVTATGAVYAYPVDSRRMYSDTFERTEREAVRLELPLEALFSPDVGFYWFEPEPITSARIAVTTPAGLFENCGIFEVRGGQTMSSVRAMCPGVGYVETDTWAGNSNASWKSVTRLVAYRVVLPR